ncbi:MAG: hypothetical protein KGQ51_06935 [Planctomycetes bacterium]|nr:hypothetical protein [Planctomycetota bacterium]
MTRRLVFMYACGSAAGAGVTGAAAGAAAGAAVPVQDERPAVGQASQAMLSQPFLWLNSLFNRPP